MIVTCIGHIRRDYGVNSSIVNLVETRHEQGFDFYTVDDKLLEIGKEYELTLTELKHLL